MTATTSKRRMKTVSADFDMCGIGTLSDLKDLVDGWCERYGKGAKIRIYDEDSNRSLIRVAIKAKHVKGKRKPPWED